MLCSPTVEIMSNKIAPNKTRQTVKDDSAQFSKLSAPRDKCNTCVWKKARVNYQHNLREPSPRHPMISEARGGCTGYDQPIRPLVRPPFVRP